MRLSFIYASLVMDPAQGVCQSHARTAFHDPEREYSEKIFLQAPEGELMDQNGRQLGRLTVCLQGPGLILCNHTY